MLKIERDKWYVLRRGNKVRCICTDYVGDRPLLFQAEDGTSYLVRADGTSPYTNNDVVSEYTPPPPLVECWVNVYEDDGSRVAHRSAERAKEGAAKWATRVAVHMREVRDEK